MISRQSTERVKISNGCIDEKGIAIKSSVRDSKLEVSNGNAAPAKMTPSMCRASAEALLVVMRPPRECPNRNMGDRLSNLLLLLAHFRRDKSI